MRSSFLSIKHIENMKLVVFTAFIIGILTHGEMIFYKISMHDDIGLFFSTGGLSQGRWAARLYDIMARRLFGEKYSLPVFLSLNTLLVIALSAWLVVDMLEVKEKINIIFITSLMVIFPSVTISFMYQGSILLSYIALFLCVLAAWFTIRYKWGWLVGIPFIAVSTGLYQAYIPFYFAVLMLKGLRLVVGDIDKFKKLAFSGLISSGSGIALYLLILKWFERLKGVQASYLGMEHMTEIDFFRRLASIQKCYSDYYSILNNTHSDLQTTAYMNWVYRLLFVSVVLCFLFFVWSVRKGRLNSLILCILSFVLFPVATNAVNIMGTQETKVSFLTMYPMVLSIIAIPALLDWIKHEKSIKFIGGGYKNLIKNVILICVYGLLFLLCLNYVYMSNATYMRLSFLQEKVIAYQTTLVTRIKSAEGYKDEYPVIWCGEGNLKDLSTKESVQWDSVRFGYAKDNFEDMINNYAWKTFMKEHVGYNPDSVLQEDIPLPIQTEIENMECYPDDGSIKVINGYVLIKLGDYD